ncbi:MAG: ATP-binding cassette domain-containing protein [Clostridiales bacterium]|nr:ATP-binding cassette domain-containing protein [Clostridiales bacterium]
MSLNLASFAGMAVSSYMLFTATLSGEISAGTFAAVYSALGTVFSIMENIVTTHLGNMNKDMGKAANFIRVMDMPERTGAGGSVDLSKGIAVENIRFTYPGGERPSIEDVSLTIADGETIAIVGENGAGKSTLVRLLIGVYRPQTGRVTVGGLDTAKIAPGCVFKHTSAVFQKYQRYKMTLKENIAISDAESAVDETKMDASLKDIGAELETGWDTMLSPEFGGIDLSGGQWQHIAIARGLYRTHGFIILDEPTSSIDPVEETRIYQQFKQISVGKCAVIVTHRLGSAKLANRIIVMDKGKIVAAGTHDDLLLQSEKYFKMWEAQAKWYKNETE